VFEHRHQLLLSRRHFAARMARSALVFVGLLIVSLTIGTLGYACLADLGWVDAFLNASMILTGMGPVTPMTTSPAKLFASFYALFSGVAFLASAGVLLTPVLHRFLHRFHLEDDEKSKRATRNRPSKGNEPLDE
jgi:hypothetical protein